MPRVPVTCESARPAQRHRWSASISQFAVEMAQFLRTFQAVQDNECNIGTKVGFVEPATKILHRPSKQIASTTTVVVGGGATNERAIAARCFMCIHRSDTRSRYRAELLHHGSWERKSICCTQVSRFQGPHNGQQSELNRRTSSAVHEISTCRCEAHRCLRCRAACTNVLAIGRCRANVGVFSVFEENTAGGAVWLQAILRYRHYKSSARWCGSGVCCC
jgi:hypothetical protein